MASRPTDSSVKAALYARVSTDDGRQTVENQVRQLRGLALAREFDIFREYTTRKLVPVRTGLPSSRCCGTRD
jgi:predicted site-specific integrase-resolvase